jgi:hypothetical protein
MKALSLSLRSTLLASVWTLWCASASAQVPVLVPPPPSSPPPPILTELDDPPLFGESNGLIYLRDRRDLIRVYPHAELALEAHGFFGSRVPELRADEARVDLGPRFFVRHARFELGGEIGKRLAFDAALELRANPAIDGARDDGRDPEVALDDAWGYLDAGRGLGIMLGFFQAPFSLENRTATSDLAFMERSVAVRGFAVPAPKVLGAAFTGSTYQGVLNWTAGAFGAEAVTPGEPDRGFDVIGRLGWEPLAADEQAENIRALHFGFSFRAGTRNPRDTTSDAPAITTRQGFSLWRPTHFDGAGNRVHVLQTGTQGAVGVELRIPTKYLTLRSEAYYATRDTRETVDGAPLGFERGGRIHGISGYVELSVWPFMALGILETQQPKLGTYPQPEHLELATTLPYQDRYGAEVALMAGGINAKYEPASREGGADASAPGGDIRVVELGAAVNYWHTERFKLGVNYNVYVTPGSGGGENLAGVPGNLEPDPDTQAHRLHELAARATLMF